MTADPRSDKRKKTATAAFAIDDRLGVNDDSDDPDFDFSSVFNSGPPRPTKAKQAELPRREGSGCSTTRHSVNADDSSTGADDPGKVHVFVSGQRHL